MCTNLYKATSEANIFNIFTFYFWRSADGWLQSGRIEHQACTLTIRRHPWLPEEYPVVT
jgi:hypothetical protein